MNLSIMNQYGVASTGKSRLSSLPVLSALNGGNGMERLPHKNDWPLPFVIRKILNSLETSSLPSFYNIVFIVSTIQQGLILIFCFVLLDFSVELRCFVNSYIVLCSENSISEIFISYKKFGNRTFPPCHFPLDFSPIDGLFPHIQFPPVAPPWLLLDVSPMSKICHWLIPPFLKHRTKKKLFYITVLYISGVFGISKWGTECLLATSAHTKGSNQVFQFFYYVKKNFGQMGAMADLAKG